MHYRVLDPPKVSTLPSGDLDAAGQYRKYGRKSYCLPLPRASVSNFASVHKMVTPLDRIFHHPSQLSPHQLADMNDDAYKIHLPLETLNKCSFCNKDPVEKKLCSACGERLYCSQECNIADWKQHKVNCGQTDRIDLAQFYPFLSWMCASSYINPSRPLHPALTWKIMNNVNPDTPPVQLPDGSYAKLVMLDDTHAPDPKLAADPTNWCPQAESQDIARKLSRRLLYSGNLLPIITAVATSIFVEMYTTTSGSDPSLGYRKRLQYGSSPISDFGIAMGSVKVTPQDRLAFLRKSNGTISYEQDQIITTGYTSLPLEGRNHS
ncbi:hypothetical protein QCA50_005092 [Cerrena zonata]|uniref:MYND-type domain-containing protein n=1 Tax=Cerrena zonata TaxID=2478898 RepID=A0AAW0GP60_9APHY